MMEVRALRKAVLAVTLSAAVGLSACACPRTCPWPPAGPGGACCPVSPRDLPEAERPQTGAAAAPRKVCPEVMLEGRGAGEPQEIWVTPEGRPIPGQ